MADEDKDGGGGGGKSRLILFAVILIVAVGGSIGGTLYFLDRDEGMGDVTVAAPQADRPLQAIYHNMRPAFVVNFMAGNTPRYLQAELTVVSRDHGVVEAVINHTPLIRSKIINYFTDQDFLQIQTDEGKRVMLEDLRELIDSVVREEENLSGVQAVLLTNFVMQ